MMLKYFYYLLVLTCCFRTALLKIQCLDQNNKPVDWYVVYKLPKIDESQGLLSKGEAFMYITSETINSGWTWSAVGIQDRNTLLANTLRPFYSNRGSPYEGLWILYNDENPKLDDYGYGGVNYGGHTKGVIGADSSGGMWLVHSVPKFPPNSTQGYGYPHSGLMYGQSALCMTLTVESLNTVGKAIMYNEPDIYDQRLDANLEETYPDLTAVCKEENTTHTPWYFESKIQTAGGTSFTVFAKAKLFAKDLYDLVATKLQASLLTETWQNEEDPLPSSCHTAFQIMNIKGIAIKDREIYYRSSKDHSKWAIGSYEYWTCIGDINRAGPQEKRGGGTVCLNNKQLWEHYHSTVDRVEDCKHKYRHNYYKGRWN